MYMMIGGEVAAYARDVGIALKRSANLRHALWLDGRRDRNSADFYMIYEYAEVDLGGRKAIVAALGVADSDITRLIEHRAVTPRVDRDRPAMLTSRPAALKVGSPRQGSVLLCQIS